MTIVSANDHFDGRHSDRKAEKLLVDFRFISEAVPLELLLKSLSFKSKY